MSDRYIIHTNRQNHSEIEIERLFETLEVVATYTYKEEHGEQLLPLNKGDRILVYDVPSGQYLGVGTVDEPWDGSAVTDPDEKVAPEINNDEFHVGVSWNAWRHPGEGHNRETVNSLLGYDEHFAPPISVHPVDDPSSHQFKQASKLFTD